MSIKCERVREGGRGIISFVHRAPLPNLYRPAFYAFRTKFTSLKMNLEASNFNYNKQYLRAFLFARLRDIQPIPR